MSKLNIVESTANLAHTAWSNWMKYVFSKSVHNDDGSVTIPKWTVIRWKAQIGTNYEDLPEDMKDSDRTEAIRYIINLARSSESLKFYIQTIVTYKQHFIYQLVNGLVKYVPCKDINKSDIYFDKSVKSMDEKKSIEYQLIQASTIGRFEDKLSEDDLIDIARRILDGDVYNIISDVFYHGCEALQYTDYSIEIIFFDNLKVKRISMPCDRQLNEDDLKVKIDGALALVENNF